MKPTVLIVDDELNIRESLAKALRLSGYETVVAADGHEGVRAYREHRPNLVLLDLNMPQRNGWDTLKTISTINPLTPVIIITGRPGQHELAAAARVGALMEKPLDVPRLLQMVQALIAEPMAVRLERLARGNPGTIFCTPDHAAERGGSTLQPADRSTLREI